MPPKGKESIVRRRKEIERQQRQKEKHAKRDARRSAGGGPSVGAGELKPGELMTPEELARLRGEELPVAGDGDAADDAEDAAEGAKEVAK